MKNLLALLIMLGFATTLSADILIPGAFNRPRPRPHHPERPLPLDLNEWNNQFRQLKLTVAQIRTLEKTRIINLENKSEDKAQENLREIHTLILSARINITLLERIEKANQTIPAENRKNFQIAKQDYETLIKTIPPLPLQPVPPPAATAPAPLPPVPPQQPAPHPGK